MRAPIGPAARRWSTIKSRRTVLVVVRTVTMLWWLLDVLDELLDELSVQVVFTIIDGSAFTPGVAEAIETIGGRQIPWEQAVAYPFDLAIAASHRGELSQLHCPLLITPHGPGFTKKISFPANGRAPQPARADAGTPATTVLLTHESQRAQWRAEPGVRLIVAGDPCFDALTDSQTDRDRYRRALTVTANQKIIAVSSTWGPGALLAQRPELLAELVGQLPSDEYIVAAILHANIWTAHGAWHIRSWLRRAREGGLRLVPHREGWRATVIAADALIGDHGSVTFYAAALGVPTALAAFDAGEVTPGTPVEELGHRAPPWRTETDPVAQLDALGTLNPGRYTDLAANAFAHRGQALERYRTVVCELLRIDPPCRPPRRLAVTAPRPEAKTVAGHVVLATLEPGDEPGYAGTVNVRRHPAVLDEAPLGEPERHLAVDADAADYRLRESASVLFTTAPHKDPIAWSRATLERLPGASVAVAPISERMFASVTRHQALTVLADHTAADTALIGSTIYTLDIAGMVAALSVEVIAGPLRTRLTLTPVAAQVESG